MFYGKDTIETNFDVVLKRLEEKELFLFEPMPSYKESDKWTDEYRIRDGHTKLEDGTWVTVHSLTAYLQKMKKDTVELYDSLQDALQKNSKIRRQNTEMEFGLRTAQKSLNTALSIKRTGEYE